MSGLIALPCRNAELVIGSMIMRARQAADSVLVIDEGSTDRTAEVVARAGATLVRLAPSDGEGAGVREAVAHAARNRVTLLAVLFDDQVCRQECIDRITEPVRNGSTDLVIGRNGDGRTGLVVLNARAVERADALGTALTGFRALVERAREDGLRIRTLRIPEETGTVAARPAGLPSELRGLATFSEPRAASAAYGAVFVLVGIVTAVWSLASFNATALLYLEGLVIGTGLVVTGMLLFSSPLLADALAMVRRFSGA
ncbi:MAG: glycosyltransferase [Methanospirillum sp.]|nr:glycosyltransferase [Methanospirillum sp.]